MRAADALHVVPSVRARLGSIPRRKREEAILNTYTAVIKQDGDDWIGWIEEIPGVNCQEPTKEELLETLRVTLEEAIVLNREEARRAAEPGYVEELVQVSA